MAQLSDRIKELRLSIDMTQEEFGKLFGIVKSTVSLYESGKSTPNDQIKEQICEYFNVSLDYLLGRSDTKEKEHQNDSKCLPPNEQKLLNIYRNYMDNGFSHDLQKALEDLFPELITSNLLSPIEQKVLHSFDGLTEDNQDIIIGKMKEMLKEQRYEDSVENGGLKEAK